MRKGSERAVGPWLIGLAALALLVWAVVDFLRNGGEEARGAWPAPVARELADGAAPLQAVELHRLLPDATDDAGLPVRLDGTVVGSVTGAGFWVKDLRDNVVFVARPRGLGAGASGPTVRPGDEVRVTGVVGLLSPEAAAERLHRAGLVPSAGALVVQDVNVLAGKEGVEVLGD